MTVIKLAPGERHRQAERSARTEQAKSARARALEAEWEERQVQAVRGQQAALKADMYARHPELAA